MGQAQQPPARPHMLQQTRSAALPDAGDPPREAAARRRRDQHVRHRIALPD